MFEVWIINSIYIMKIAIFCDSFPPEINGVANFVKFSAESLAEKGHEVQVFTVSKLSEEKLNKGASKNLFVNTLPSLPALVYPDIRFTVPAALTLKRLKKFNPDVIHSHTPFALGWEAVMGAKVLKKPLVGTHHTFYDHYLKHIKIDFDSARKFTWKYTVSFYNFCDLVTTPSKSLAKEMFKNGLKGSISILPNFVNTEIFHPVSPKEKIKLKKIYKLDSNPTIVYMGRLSYEKSVDLAIKAFALVQKEFPKTNFLIIGDGPERENLEESSRKLKIKNKIKFTGFLRGEKLAEALQAGDLFLTASETETFCISALEAMATGLPVVAINKGGIGEIVKDGKNGFLSKTNAPEEVSKNLTKLLSNKNLLKEFKDNSRKFAFTYSKENVTAKLEKIYKKTVSKKI